MRSAIALLLIHGSSASLAQALPPEGCSVRYVYDEAGNRIARDWYCWGDKSLDAPSGLEKNSLTVYPNPSSDIVNLQLKAELDNAQVEIMNAQGKLFQTTNFSGSMTTVDISQLSSGTYWVRLVKDGEMLISTFTVER